MISRVWSHLKSAPPSLTYKMCVPTWLVVVADERGAARHRVGDLRQRSCAAVSTAAHGRAHWERLTGDGHGSRNGRDGPAVDAAWDVAVPGRGNDIAGVEAWATTT